MYIFIIIITCPQGIPNFCVTHWGHDGWEQKYFFHKTPQNINYNNNAIADILDVSWMIIKFVYIKKNI